MGPVIGFWSSPNSAGEHGFCSSRARKERRALDRTLRTESLSKTFQGRQVVRDISIDIHSGEVIGLLGPNGAGKTTTFACILGIVSPDGGRVVLNGEDI